MRQNIQFHENVQELDQSKFTSIITSLLIII